MVLDSEKPLIWLGSSKRDLMSLPVPVRKFFGHALHFAQQGDRHGAARVLKGVGSADVLEILADAAAGTFRAVYTVRSVKAVFVLHCFQKKSKSGIATPKRDMDVIRTRLKAAEALAKEMKNANAGH